MKVCPKCGNNSFLLMSQYSNVNVEYNEATDTFEFNNEQDCKSGHQVKCNKCQTTFQLWMPEIKQQFIHQLIPCKKCSNRVTPQELDESGVCTICRLKEQDPEFANMENADPATLFRMLALAKIENNKLSNANQKLAKDLENAKEVEQKIEEINSKPVKQRKPRKKKDDTGINEGEVETTEDTTINVDGNEEDVETDIEISEDVAPDLPDSVNDISDAMNPPEEA